MNGMKTLSKHKHASVKRNIKHRRKRSSSRSSSSRTYRKKHSHSKRNRNQRGGKTKQEWYLELKKSYIDACLNPQKTPSVAIVKAFKQLDFDVNDPSSCIKFRRLLRIRDESSKSLSDVVCSDINKIEGTETAYMEPLMKDNGLYTPDSFTNWINFVKHMNRAVSEFALQDLPKPSRAQSQSSAAADERRPAPVVDSRPQLPEGWTQSGPDHAPIYFTTNGHSLRGEFPTMPAREFELAKRLAQINDDAYVPPPLTQKDQESAKQSRASLPDVKEVSAYDRLMAFNPND